MDLVRLAFLSAVFTAGCSAGSPGGLGGAGGTDSGSGDDASRPTSDSGGSGPTDGSDGVDGGGGADGSGADGSGADGSGADGSGGTVQEASSPDATTDDSSAGSPEAGGEDSDWGTPVTGGPTGTGAAATVTVNSSRTVGTIGPGFAGFSYEKTHITNDSLSPTNTSLIALHKLLGSPVTRLGGGDVDRCYWTGAGAPPAAPSGEPFSFGVTTGMVDELCSFLAATGTKIIYGVNYEKDDVTASAAEVAYVEGKCGSSIYGFEIGNEIGGSWDSDRTQWESFATAVVATTGADLIGPAAVGGSAETFTTPFAADVAAKYPNKLVLLTQHYYAGSAGSSATVARLQTPDPEAPTDVAGLVGQDTAVNSAAVTNKIPDGYRLGECNTFSGHGQSGVSDTLISGLWSVDVMFVTAEHGGSGVNFHGGETGMDRTKPFYYEPIMENKGVVVEVQPVYYGMLLFSLAGQGPMVSTTVATSSPDFTAYAITAHGFTSVVLDNKSSTTGVNVTVNLGEAVSHASAIYLQATPAGSLTATAGNVTLAGAQVTAAGVWNRNPPFIQTTSGNTASVYVPAASAALVRVQ